MNKQGVRAVSQLHIRLPHSRLCRRQGFMDYISYPTRQLIFYQDELLWLWKEGRDVDDVAVFRLIHTLNLRLALRFSKI